MDLYLRLIHSFGMRQGPANIVDHAIGMDRHDHQLSAHEPLSRILHAMSTRKRGWPVSEEHQSPRDVVFLRVEHVREWSAPAQCLRLASPASGCGIIESSVEMDAVRPCEMLRCPSNGTRREERRSVPTWIVREPLPAPSP